MNIFIRELRSGLKSLIIWSLIVILFNYVGFSKFTAYYGNPEMLAILDSLPPAMLKAFDMNAFNLTTLTGFYGVMVAYFCLILPSRRPCGAATSFRRRSAIRQSNSP